MTGNCNPVKKDKRSKATRQSAFLKRFSITASITDAAFGANIGRQTVYNWLNKDAAFAQRIRAVETTATDYLEDEAVRRAVQGDIRYVYYKGDIVGNIRKCSDALLMALLKARRPEKFVERVVKEVKNTSRYNTPLTGEQIRQIQKELEEKY